MTVNASVRTTIWLGLPEEGGEIRAWEVQREDDMIMIEADAGGRDQIEVFIGPELFPAIRAIMDRVEEPDGNDQPLNADEREGPQ